VRPGYYGADTRHRHDQVAGHLAVAVADHRHPGPAQQGDRRSQRIRA
jgi:hypothetical protein